MCASFHCKSDHTAPNILPAAVLGRCPNGGDSPVRLTLVLNVWPPLSTPSLLLGSIGFLLDRRRKREERATFTLTPHTIGCRTFDCCRTITRHIVLFTFCANRPMPNTCLPFPTTRRRFPPCPLLRRIQGWRLHRATPLSSPPLVLDFLHWPAPREHTAHPKPSPVEPSATCLAHIISPASSFSSSSSPSS